MLLTSASSGGLGVAGGYRMLGEGEMEHLAWDDGAEDDGTDHAGCCDGPSLEAGASKS